MDILNRSAVILRPREPYLEWARLDDKEGLAADVVETLRREPSVYLVPGWEERDEEVAVLKEFWPVLFELMLCAWVTDEQLWPKGRSLEMFRAWFDIESHALVEDVYMDEAIEYLE